MEAARDQQHVALQRGGDRALRHRLLIELSRDHRAEATDLAEARVRSKRRELLDHDLADGLGPRDKILVANHLKRGESGRARHGIAPERRAVRPRAPTFHALARRDAGAKRHAAAERLCGSDDIGRHAELLRREPGAGTAHSCLDLVEYEKRADLRRELS